jgi:hypothetical protein
MFSHTSFKHEVYPASHAFWLYAMPGVAVLAVLAVVSVGVAVEVSAVDRPNPFDRVKASTPGSATSASRKNLIMLKTNVEDGRLCQSACDTD